MPTSYLPYQPTQDLLLPPSLRDWLPQDHLAHYISDTIDELDLSAFYRRYEGGGPRNQPFHPAMMVKVLVYAYATGLPASCTRTWRFGCSARATSPSTARCVTSGHCT
jgi:transposase